MPSLATAVATPYAWSDEFRAFTLQHLATLALFFGLMAASCWLGRRWMRDRAPGTPPARGTLLTLRPPGAPTPGEVAEWRFRLAWIWTTIAWQAYAVIFFLLPANFDWYESLPLHLCDVAAWVAPFALLTQARWLRTLLYFWGIALSTQAFFTPVVEGGHAELRYWLFFVGHTHIVGSAIYDVVVLGYRPYLRDWGLATLLSLCWIVPTTFFNIAMNVNYGYTGNFEVKGTALEFLGPWPWRIAALFGVGQVMWFLTLAPWMLARALGWSAPTKAASP